MSADPSASIWEVTRMILDSPGTSPSAIAHAHGFSAVEVTELLPIFLDNLRADFSSGGGPALVPPVPQPGETPEEHADRYLRELAQNEHLDVVGYDTLGVVDGPDGGADLDGADLDGADLDGADLDGADLDGHLDQDPAFLDAPPADGIELDDVAIDLPDQHLDDLGADDPFAAAAPVEIDLPAPADSFDDDSPDDIPDDIPDDAADDPGEPFAMG